MLFQSYLFIFAFLPIVVCGYYLCNHFRRYQAGLWWLLAASLFFYGYYDWRFVPVIVVSAFLNFTFAHLILKWQNVRKPLLVIALVCDVGFLVYCKYSGFILDNINALLNSQWSIAVLLVPLGLSFYTFQQIAYLVDCYRGEGKYYRFDDYLLFVSFFPYIISGPIAFHHEIIPQFHDPERKSFSSAIFSKGITIFTLGICKKVLIADTLGAGVDWGYANAAALNTTTAVAVILGYALQLYFDFSGYCDMAKGVALLLRIDIPQNFNSPYKAVNIQAFWRRWHMTMTRFFTKYVYIPLGGNRRGDMRTYENMLFVFALSGLWHGASWTFVIWGLLHGAALALYRWGKRFFDRLGVVCNWLLTFVFVNLAWVFFRAPSLDTVKMLFYQLATCNIGPLHESFLACFKSAPIDFFVNLWHGTPDCYLPFIAIALPLVLLAAILALPNSDAYVENFKPSPLHGIMTATILFWALISLNGVTAFLYFTF